MGQQLISDILENNKRGFSYEFFPPKSRNAYENLGATIKTLMLQKKPLFVSITETGKNSGQDSKTPTFATVSIVKNAIKNIPIMPHFTCFNLSIDEASNYLLPYEAMGINNVFIIRGDINSAEELQEGSFGHANELVFQLQTRASCYEDFPKHCIGVAYYPETHPESSSITEDRKNHQIRLANADFAISQLFFDNDFQYDFQNWAISQNINIPLIPGILTDFSKVVKFYHGCNASIPRNVMTEIAKYENKPKELKKFTIDFVSKQVADLYDNGVKAVHFFTVNKVETLPTIINNLRGYFQ